MLPALIVYPRYSFGEFAFAEPNLKVMPLHPSEGLVEVLHMLLPSAAAKENIVEVNDGVVKPFEDVLHQS